MFTDVNCFNIVNAYLKKENVHHLMKVNLF